MKTLLTGLFLVLAGFTVYASGNYDSVVYIKDANLALEGYDKVAYFVDDLETMIKDAFCFLFYPSFLFYRSIIRRLL